MKYTIDIPEPCQENWANMSPVEKGKFCSVCSKNVLDLTKCSKEEIIEQLKGKDGICARIKSSELSFSNKWNYTGWKVNWAFALSFGSMLFISLPAFCQSIPDQNTLLKTERIDEKLSADLSVLHDTVFVSGVVMDEFEVIPYVNIVLKQFKRDKWQTIRGMVTNQYGGFNLPILDSDKSFKLKIEISYIGYKRIEIPISEDVQPLKIMMKEEVDLITGMILIGEPKINPPTSKETNYTREGNELIKEVK